MHTLDGQALTNNCEPEALKEHKSHRNSNSCFKSIRKADTDPGYQILGYYAVYTRKEIVSFDSRGKGWISEFTQVFHLPSD